MLTTSLGIALATLAAWGLWALLRRALRSGVDAATPAAVAVAASSGALLLGTTPFFAILRAVRPVDPSVQRWGLQLALGTAIALAAIVSGVRMVRSSGDRNEAVSAGESPVPWIATTVLLALLALAGSVVLIDAQLLFLGGAGVIWLRARPEVRPGPVLTAATLGLIGGWGTCIVSGIPGLDPNIIRLALAGGLHVLLVAACLGGAAAAMPSRASIGGLTAILAAMLGLGFASISYALLTMTLFFPAVRDTPVGAAIWVAGELTVGQPLRWGLSTLWLETAICGVACTALSVGARPESGRSVARFCGLSCAAAGLTLLTLRLAGSLSP